MRVFDSPASCAPQVKLLSNGRYQVVISNAGGGYSRWRDLAVTRWREDATRDCWGTFIYLREPATGEFWSTAFQPTLHPAESYKAIFTHARAEFRLQKGDLEIHTRNLRFAGKRRGVAARHAHQSFSRPALDRTDELRGSGPRASGS